MLLIYSYICAYKTDIQMKNPKIEVSLISEIKVALFAYQEANNLSTLKEVAQKINQWAKEKGLQPFLVEKSDNISKGLSKQPKYCFGAAEYNLIKQFIEYIKDKEVKNEMV